MWYFNLSLLFGLLLCSCREATQPTRLKTTATRLEQNVYQAQNFSIQKQGIYTILTIKRAWAHAPQVMEYVLYPKSDKAPSDLFPKASCIPVPVEKILCTGTAQVALLDFLGQTDKIVASTSCQYVYHKPIQEGLRTGKIKDLGKNGAIDYEGVVMAAPELILAFRGTNNTEDYEGFKALGIPVVYISEYMENTALGRTEWARFLAPLFGEAVERDAEKRYLAIEKEYKELRKQMETVGNRPKVFTGIDYEGTWHVAGGQSFIAKWIEDAGGDYIWKENRDIASVGLDMEAVYDKILDADIWLNVLSVHHKADLTKKNPRYNELKAFRRNQIFSYTKRISSTGAYDFFESAIIQPQVVLKDLIKIFHPNQLPNHEFYYYQQLN